MSQIILQVVEIVLYVTFTCHYINQVEKKRQNSVKYSIDILLVLIYMNRFLLFSYLHRILIVIQIHLIYIYENKKKNVNRSRSFFFACCSYLFVLECKLFLISICSIGTYQMQLVRVVQVTI